MSDPCTRIIVTISGAPSGVEVATYTILVKAPPDMFEKAFVGVCEAIHGMRFNDVAAVLRDVVVEGRS